MLEAAWSALADPALAYPALLTAKVAAITLVFHLILGLGLGWAGRWRSRNGPDEPCSTSP